MFVERVQATFDSSQNPLSLDLLLCVFLVVTVGGHIHVVQHNTAGK